MPLRTMPSAGTRSPARSSIRSPTLRSSLFTISDVPSGLSRRLSTSVSLRSAFTASCEPSMLRSSSTWPIVMMIGRNAAVMRSPVAQAATSASATSRSVMPCRLGCRQARPRLDEHRDRDERGADARDEIRDAALSR